MTTITTTHTAYPSVICPCRCDHMRHNNTRLYQYKTVAKNSGGKKFSFQQPFVHSFDKLGYPSIAHNTSASSLSNTDSRPCTTTAAEVQRTTRQHDTSKRNETQRNATILGGSSNNNSNAAFHQRNKQTHTHSR